eukprot:9066012-Pyramimonas_sp.AAC.1
MADDVQNNIFPQSCNDEVLETVQATVGSYFNTGVAHYSGFAWKSTQKTRGGDGSSLAVHLPLRGRAVRQRRDVDD